MFKVDIGAFGKWAEADNAKVLRQFNDPRVRRIQYYAIYPGGDFIENAHFTSQENAVRFAYTYQMRKGTHFWNFSICRFTYVRNSKGRWVEKNFETVGHLFDESESDSIFPKALNRWVYWSAKGYHVVRRGTITDEEAKRKDGISRKRE